MSEKMNKEVYQIVWKLFKRKRIGNIGGKPLQIEVIATSKKLRRATEFRPATN
jgi:hypothetical protein